MYNPVIYTIIQMYVSSFMTWKLVDILHSGEWPKPQLIPSGLRAWDSLFTMKHGVWEVVGSIPNQGNILGVFHPARITGKAFWKYVLIF